MNTFFYRFTLIALLNVGCVELKAQNLQNYSVTDPEVSGFKLIKPNDLPDNAFKVFSDDWFILTAGKEQTYNPMTISWGNFGYLWGYPTVTVYVRPDRHTYGFMEKSSTFTICTFDEKHRSAMRYIGSKSGRDGDKIKATGLTAKLTAQESLYYEEAHLIIECEKVFSTAMNPDEIIDPKMKKYYQGGQKPIPVHKMYIGKILNIWVKE
jgi:flavin reductase (DIM6/NTAB) family NADH-FMN oxidoreductase RutF